MHIVLTICSGVILIACCFLLWRTIGYHDNAHGWFLKAEAQALKLRAERDRVTVLERELEALRREIRKLSGKFYSSLRETVVPVDELLPTLPPAYCDNWSRAQQSGPRSEYAACECDYCTRRRADRSRQREELVPKTARGQAEAAKLNAGKP